MVIRRSHVSPPWIQSVPTVAMPPLRSSSVAASVAYAEAPFWVAPVCMSPPPAS